MARSSRIIAIVVIAALIVGAAAFVVAWRPAIAAISPPARQSFDPALVRRGRDLAAIGNCNSCHTVRGGQNYAGGLPVPTPFGTIFSSNITPDAETGIGQWSEEAFGRAMRSGVDREGRHLYPTFPYDHFTNVSDEDDRALYAFLMTRPAAHSPPRQNELAFPFDQRPLIAGWKLLFLRQDNFRPDPAKSQAWNRGGYLVEGLAHCGACHTPRNALGAERKSAAFAGGEADNWLAYAINSQSPSPVPWNEDALFAYLRHGWHRDHGVARGPMAEVVNNLSSVDENDVRAIATYTIGIFGPSSPDRIRRGEDAQAKAEKRPQPAPETSVSASVTGAPASANEAGPSIYAAACATCHETSRPLPYAGIDLHLSSGISAPDPRNVANTVLYGLPAVEGERSPIMPGFAASMTDAQIAALLTYLRAHFSDRPAWSNVDRTVADARQAQAAYLQTSAGPPNVTADPGQRGKP